MTQTSKSGPDIKKQSWWRSIGPALITASVVLGPGSLLISSNVGASYRYQMLWLLIMTGILMFTFVSMSARIAVVSGATPCTVLSGRAGRPFAAIVGINLSLICATFQFSNNLAFSTAIGALVPGSNPYISLLLFNAVIIIFLLSARKIYKVVERLMKIMVGLIVVSFLLNLLFAKPEITAVLKGLIPSVPDGVTLTVPRKVDGVIKDPMVLIASLIGTTLSVAGAFYQGNLVREKGWSIKDYKHGIGDSLFGISVLTCISAIIMITAATVIPEKPATDIGVLAQSLKPLLGSAAYIFFCTGLLAVSMNPFLINAMIGGSILADGIGKDSSFNSSWSKGFTICVLLIGMIIAMFALKSGQKPINLIIFGQAMIVIANPLMAGVLLYLANCKDIMGQYKNSVLVNIIGFAGFIFIVAMAVRMLVLIYLKLLG